MICLGIMSEYIKRRMSVIDLQKELNKLIKKYNELQGTYLIIYAGAIGKPVPDIPLNIVDYYYIIDILKNVNSKKLDFYIETPGGSAEAVEEIVTFIRSNFENITFIVSGQAKSAGTILVLSGDEIMMTQSGSLGPIDAQVKIGRSIISARDYIEWIDERREEAETNRRLNPLDATMVAQISPGEFNFVLHALKFAEDLVVKWLPKYKFKDWKTTETRKLEVTEKMKEERAKDIAGKLMDRTKWRVHGRSIKIADLERIGLKITRIDDDPHISDIVYRIQSLIHLLFLNTTSYKIFMTAEDKLFKKAVLRQQPVRIPKKRPDVAEGGLICPKCGNQHKLYVKFSPNPKLDKDFQKRGAKKLPKDNKLVCDCGFEIDVSGLRNEIEAQVGRKIVD